MQVQEANLGLFLENYHLSIDVPDEAVAYKLRQKDPSKQVLYLCRLHDQARLGFGYGK